MKLEIEVPEPPEGYEYTGEYRSSREGELFLSDRMVLAGRSASPWLILRKKRWRANNGLHYCYVGTNGDICTTDEYQGYIDNSRYRTGNYFRTKEEAKASKFYKVFHQKEEL